MNLCRRPLLPTRIYAFAAAVLVSIAINGCGNTSATSSSGTTPTKWHFLDKCARRRRCNCRRLHLRRPEGRLRLQPIARRRRRRREKNGRRQGHGRGAASSETADVQKSMESMIQLDGAKLIFPTSFGYFDPHVLVMAKKYPDVMFLHCGGLWNEKVHPKNVGSYFGYIDECQYLSGIVAGHTTKSKKIGFVAAKPIPQVRRNINAFELGARSVDPKITCTVIFTGDWSMPVKEAEATNSLIDQGVDVVTCPRRQSEGRRRKRPNAAAFIPAATTAAKPHSRPRVISRAPSGTGRRSTPTTSRCIKSHQKIPRPAPRRSERTNRQDVTLRSGGERKGQSRPRRPVKSKLVAGNFVIFKGELKDNTGKVVIPGRQGTCADGY